MLTSAQQIDRETWYKSLLQVQRLVDDALHVALRQQVHSLVQKSVDTRLPGRGELVWSGVARSVWDQAEETDREL